VARDQKWPYGTADQPAETTLRGDYQPLGANDVNCFGFPAGTVRQLLLDETDDWTKLFELGMASNAPSDRAV